MDVSVEFSLLIYMQEIGFYETAWNAKAIQYKDLKQNFL